MSGLPTHLDAAPASEAELLREDRRLTALINELENAAGDYGEACSKWPPCPLGRYLKRVDAVRDALERYIAHIRAA